jgi:CBS-domain-containing membrane protein
MKQWTVQDVMTRDVVAVGTDAPYQEIINMLSKRGISAVPVVDDSRRVLGVVSEADLLCKVEFAGEDAEPRPFAWGTGNTMRAKAHAGTAAELMTEPAVTVQPGSSLTAAAKLLDSEHVKRLPVIDKLGRLVGIVARSDLLSVYLRPDNEIREAIVEDVLWHMLRIDPFEVEVDVLDGVVTLTGSVDRKSSAQIAARVVATLPGVVRVVDKLTSRYDDAVVTATTELSERR